MNIIPLITPILKIVFNKLEEYIKDKNEVEKLKSKIEHAILVEEYETIKKELEAKKEIIVAEAQSDSWLTRNWRPITMMVFLFLLVSYWFGFAIPNIDQSIIDEIFSIIKIGLGGYIVGRSAEKIIRGLKQ